MQALRPLRVVPAALIAAVTVSAQSPPTPKPGSLPAHTLVQRWQRPAPPRPAAASGGGVARAAVNEVERNETIGFTDDLAGQTDYDGNINPTGDTDVVRFDLLLDGLVTFDMSAIGTFPNQDATLLLRDVAGQFVAYNDDRSTSLWPLIIAPLPAGTYFCEAAGVAHSTAGTYRLTVTSVPAAFAPVTHNGTTSGVVPAGGELALTLTLASDARVVLAVTANGGQNPYLFVLRSTGSVLRRVADSSTGPDPALNGHLPAGRYILVFGDSNGVGGPLSFTTTVTPGPVPALACGGSVTGSGTGLESMALYELNLAANSRVDLQVSPTGATPMSDPHLWLFDRRMNVILHADDDGSSQYPRVITPLPAGRYFVGVQPDSNTVAGTFQLAAACAPASPPMVRWAPVAASIAAQAETSAHVFQAGTPIPFEFRTLNATFQNPVLSVIDADGNALAFSDYAVDLIGNRSGTANLWVLVRDYNGATGSYTLDIRAQNYFAGPNKVILTMFDKAGQIHYPFASASTLSFPFPVPSPFTGNLLINVPLVPVPPVTIPTSGWRTYPAFFPNGAYLIQSLSLTASPLGGSMANVAR